MAWNGVLDEEVGWTLAREARADLGQVTLRHRIPARVAGWPQLERTKNRPQYLTQPAW